MTEPFLSVVIPVFNTEAYLNECLDSVYCLEETIEIIAVNDGSTDGSREILEDHAGRHSHFRILDIQNSGPSVARNVGLSVARGQYILFVDSDDFLARGALDKIIVSLKTRVLDCLLYAASIQYDSSQADLKVRINYERPESLRDHVMSGSELFEIFLAADSYVVQPCLYVFRRSCASHILFYPGVHHEDNLFTTELLLSGGVDRAMCTTEHYYVRRVRNNSITTSRVSLKDYWDLHAVLTALLAMREKGRVPAQAVEGFGKFVYALTKFKLRVLISLFGPFFPIATRWSSLKLLVKRPRIPGSAWLMLCFLMPEILVPMVISAKRIRGREGLLSRPAGGGRDETAG